MKGHDFIPQADEDFLDWSKNFVSTVLVNAALWAIPAEITGALQAQLAAYEAKLTVAQGANHGKVDIAEKNAAKDALEHTERDAVKRFLAWNPAVTDSQREALGITVHDSKRRPIPAPHTRPEFSFKIIDLMRIQIDFRDQGSEHRAIPYGYNGAVFSYATESAPVSDYAQFGKSILMTHSPFTLELPPETQGKTLSGALQWQNSKGEKGPWSEIQSVIVP